MAVVGCLGDIVFSVSSNQVRTFNNMKWESSTQYAQHNRHLQDVLLEYTGTNPDTISFSMFFSKFCGVDPILEITKIIDAERKGEIMRLVIGNKTYGKYKWVITKSSKALNYFDGHGNLQGASIDVSLTAYVNR